MHYLQESNGVFSMFTLMSARITTSWIHHLATSNIRVEVSLLIMLILNMRSMYVSRINGVLYCPSTGPGMGFRVVL